ncbi:DNA-binding pseudobarrel domain-containing protein [Tanacetum coccineum]
MAKGEIDNLTMEQYLALTRGNQAPGVVKPEIGGNVNFEIKSQFMRELREDTFSGNKNDDAHEHVERVLDIVSLFNIPGVSHDAVMLRVFPITLTGAAKRWVDRLPLGPSIPGTSLKKPLSKGNVHHQRLPSSLKKSATSSKKETKHYTKFGSGPPGYYTRIDNRLSFGEKRPSLEELMNKHLEESTRRRAEMEEWVKKLQENAEINTRNQSASLKNLETQIEQLTKEFHTKAANEINNSSFDHCKAVYAEKKTPHDDGQHEVSFDNCTQIVQEKVSSSKILPCASVNVIPKSMFEHLKLAQLKKTDMLVEMADMTKRSPIGIVENVLVKIDKFLFPSDFVVMDMLNTRNETMILGRPFLATIHAKIDVFNKEISLGIGADRVTLENAEINS